MKLPKNRRVLFIGDLHAPFTLPNYLSFCKRIYHKYGCNIVIFAGDILDNHYISFHDTDPDGHGGAQELELAKEMIKEWYKAFPKALVCLGNHDVLPQRRAFNAGVTKAWVKKIGDILPTPGWVFSESFIIDNVLYCHGMGRKGHSRMKADLISVAQGHYHSDSAIIYLDGAFTHLFSLQVGCGFDRNSYAAAYGKNLKFQAHNVGAILENGTLPIIERMYV